MKVRIEADGTVYGTRVYDADGKDISNKVSAVYFRQQAGGLPKIDLTFLFGSGMLCQDVATPIDESALAWQAALINEGCAREKP